MRFRKRLEKGLKQLAIAVVIASVAAFFYLRWERARPDAPPPAKPQAGYKAEDRKRLEQLIHEGAKDD